MLIRYKCRCLVLKPLTRHYTLIPIFDPYRFLMSNQYRGAGSAIPKSIRVHGGGSSLFASAAQLLERRPADVRRGRGWKYWLYFSVFTGDTGGHGRRCGAVPERVPEGVASVLSCATETREAETHSTRPWNK